MFNSIHASWITMKNTTSNNQRSKTIFLAIAFLSGLVMSLSIMGILDKQQAFSVEQKYVDLMNSYVANVTQEMMKTDGMMIDLYVDNVTEQICASANDSCATATATVGAGAGAYVKAEA